MDVGDYETHDIYLAAYFKIAGCEMSGRHKVGNRWYFKFSNPAGPMQDIREAYYSGKGQVPAVRFAQEIQNMKELCFD